MPSIAFEEALRYYLNTTGAPLGVISQRAYVNHTTQRKDRPYLVIQDITQRPLHAQDGPANLLQRTYQLSVFDDSQSDGIGLADSLRRLIDGFKGMMGPPGQELRVGTIQFRYQNYLYEREDRVHGFHQDYFVQYTEVG